MIYRPPYGFSRSQWDKHILSKIKSIHSAMFYTIYGVCVFSLPIYLVTIVRIRVLCLIIFIKSEVWPIYHSLGSGHEALVCAVCLSIFLCGKHMSSCNGSRINANYERIASWVEAWFRIRDFGITETPFASRSGGQCANQYFGRLMCFLLREKQLPKQTTGRCRYNEGDFLENLIIARPWGRDTVCLL